MNSSSHAKRTIAINSAWAAGTRVVQVALLVWLQQYLLKRIDPAEYSLLAVVQAALFLMPLLSTSLISASARFLTESFAKGRLDAVSQATRSMLPVVSLAAGAISVLGGLLVIYLDKIFLIPPHILRDARLMLTLMAGTYALRIWFVPFFSGIFVVQKHRVYYMVELCCEILKLALLLALLFGVSTRILWLTVAQCATSLIETALTVWLSLRYLP